MKYPDQIKAIVRQKNLIVDAKLSLPANQIEDPPLEMYSPFSRFLFTIKTTENNQNVFNKANVVVEDVPDIVKRTEFALSLIFNSELGPVVKGGTQTDSPAFTVKLIDKNFKGQSPAEVLLKNPDAKKQLLQTRDWLNSNLASYPKNAQAIDAINEAVKLLESGQLQADTVPTKSGSFKVYETENKYFTSDKEKDKEGNHKIYHIEVMCTPTNKYPFTVSIMNCYAPLDHKPGGATQIRMSAAKNKTEASISLAEKEWVNIVGRLVKTMDNFESVHASKQFDTHAKNTFKPNEQKTA